jgi:two-component system, OmpR family, sensor kinase
LTRVPIRVRLAIGFALAMVLVIAAATGFAYLRVRADLNETIDDGLQERAQDALLLARRSRLHLVPSRRPPDVEEDITQLLGPGGRILDTTGRASVPTLDPAQVRRAAAEPVVAERRVPDIDGPIRVLAKPVWPRPGSPIVVVGQAVDDRNDVLASLVRGFALGGPVAVLVASVLGYLLAAAGLAPMEAMRRRASEVSLEDDSQPLPLPRAHDEVRRLGETLNRMLERLRRSFERERRFVADASHELRTPVAVVKAELEGALRVGEYGPRVRDALVAAVEECDRLGQLAEDLLVVARAADGQLPVRGEDLDAGSILQSVRSRFVDRANQQGRRIRVEAADGLEVRADPLRIRQALGNLVDNALRHGRGEIVLRARRSGAGVEIEVADQGGGFPPEIAQQAFERFTRGDRARTRGGVGLGMAIVRAIAEAHGGSSAIAAEARTAVVVWLPDGTPAATVPG